jgi:DNA replication licensing factor MCM3
VHYGHEIARMVEQGKNRLIVKLADLRRFDTGLAQRILDSPISIMPPFEEALSDVVKAHIDLNNPASKLSPKASFRVGIQGSFGALRVTPRQLTSDVLSKMLCVEGIVTKCSLIRPKIVESVHYCPDTGKFSQQTYRDATALMGSRTGSSFPTKDAEGHPLETEFGMCTFRDYQTITIQEMPEKAPKGQLPCSVDVILDDDLVDSCKPGDRIQVIGIYRALPPSNTASTSGIYRTLMLSNNVSQMGRSMNSTMDYTTSMDTPLSRQDIEDIRKISKRQDHFDLLARSLAPSIFGHE